MRPWGLALLLLLPAGTRAGLAAGFVHRRGEAIVDGEGRPALRRGVNLGGWLLWESYFLRLGGIETESRIKRRIVELAGEEEAHRFFRAYRNAYTTRKDLRRIRKLGLDHVRLPFNSRILTDDPHFDLTPAEGWRTLDRLLDWCEREGLHVVLDMHSAPGGQNAGGISDNDLVAGLWKGPDMARHRARTVALWREIAERYRNRTVVAAYDLLNEPVIEHGIDPVTLVDLLREITAAVREVDPDHLLMYEGNWYATDFSMFKDAPLDPNSAWHFHKYWSDTNTDSIRYLLDLRRNSGVPIWLGETGENGHQWYQRLFDLMERHGIGWCFWPWKRIGGGCFQAMDHPESWRRTADVIGGGADPASLSKAELIRGLDDLVEAARIEHCREDRMTVKALRGEIDLGSWLFEEFAAKIEAEDYLPEGSRDADEENRGDRERPGPVDVQKCGEGGWNVGWTEAGEVLAYAFPLGEGGRFDLYVRSAAEGEGGAIALELDGEALGRVELPGTGGWQNWQDTVIRDLDLDAGRHALRVEIVRKGSNLNYFLLTK